nr:retrotransposon protein, putative, Ty1-copia subclass [Tanacetum cinerariifolium]
MTNETNVTAPVNVTGASVTNTVANHAEKPEKFNGQSFKRWQQKMFFYLTTLNLARFLKETAPQVEPPKEGLQILIHEIHAEGMTVSETFQVAVIIEKLPPSWGTCYNCDQPGHRTANCKMPKQVNLRQTNMVNDNMDMIVMVSGVITMISEVNLVGSNNSGWWVDTGATRHVCADKSMFYSFRAVDNEEKLYMGNYATSDINGEGDVILKMTFEQQDDNDLLDKRQDQLEEEEVEQQRSKKARTEESFGPDFVSFMVENEPTSYREVITSSEGHQWKEAIKSEIDFILQNHTWELMDLPLGCKPLGYKWIFKKKIKADGTIDKYKARLVIKGFRQREGIDYFDTYSPVMRITSIRMILAIVALINLEVHQMDVKTAFLNRDLEEEIYMNQPKGFIAPGQEGKVYRLVKSLYGLNQAPKQWHQKFDHTMLESGFKINEYDNNDKMIKSTKVMLKSKFDMKDMGLADVILGIKIIRTHNGLVLSTRPDLAYAVSWLSRYTSNPSDAHWKAMTRVLYYLRYSHNYRLHYDRYLAVIEGYSDANWISDIKDSRSTSEYVFTLRGSGISWKSSKQTVIAKSMMKSEFIALDKYEEEAEWLRQFIEDIPRVNMNEISCLKVRHLKNKMWKLGKYPTSPHKGNEKKFKYNSWFLPSDSFRSGCTTALNVVPWETDGQNRWRKRRRDGYVWTTKVESLEDAFLWIAVWRPTTMIHLLYYKPGHQLHARLDDSFRTTLGDLSLNQINRVDELQRKTIHAESVGICMVDLSSTASEILRKNNDGDEEIKENVQTLNSLLGSKEDKLEEVLHMADGLRMETLKSVVEILTPLQAVRFLIAAAELHLRLYDCGQKRDTT